MTDDQAYRAMNLLVVADTDASVQEAVFFVVADLLNLEVDLLVRIVETTAGDTWNRVREDLQEGQVRRTRRHVPSAHRAHHPPARHPRQARCRRTQEDHRTRAATRNVLTSTNHTAWTLREPVSVL